MTVEKFKVTCPTCGRAREVKGRSYYNAIMRGRESDRCKPCGAKAGIQKRLAAIARKKEGETIESCGCVLTFAETFCEDGCWMSRRCEKWDDRAKFATQVAGRLMSAGLIVCSPINRWHAVCEECGLFVDYNYWKESARAFVAWCTDLYVICVPGWRESTRVSAEILLAEKMGKNIVYLRPGNYFFDGVFTEAC